MVCRLPDDARLVIRNVLTRQVLYFAIIAVLASDVEVFWVLFLLRYLRLAGNIISYAFLYRAAPVRQHARYTRRDCSVIVPTVDPRNADFDECVASILQNEPKQLIVVTAGADNLATLARAMAPLRAKFPRTQVLVGATDRASKRMQVAHGIPQVTGHVTVLVDDHVFWPSTRFLPAALAPFDDDKVGLVGTWKRVRRDPVHRGFSAASVANMLGCTYLARHNFELCATSALDAGVFVISGRTSLLLTCVVQNDEFIGSLVGEKFFFGMFGPLNADDDNFITRWLVERHWKIRFQASRDAVVETTLGTDWRRFAGQCERWVRTTWRSNSALLLRQPKVWLLQPWCLYAVYLANFANFALLWDAALVVSLLRSELYAARGGAAVVVLVYVMLASKTVKLWGHWRRDPRDMLLFPCNVLFGYAHGLLKAWALVTFWDNSWGGRSGLAEIGGGQVQDSWEIKMQDGKHQG